MAADTRPFKSKEQDGQGNEVIVRDQQLVEQTSQTTMASGEYFEIVDVDGRMAKIPKDNMIGVVREALGTLLNGLADQTTVTKALTLNGDTLGASTAATLASVLGVGNISQGGYLTSSDDVLTKCAKTGCWYYSNGNVPQNAPVSNSTTILVSLFLSNTYGICITASGNGEWKARFYMGGWSSEWQKISMT